MIVTFLGFFFFFFFLIFECFAEEKERSLRMEGSRNSFVRLQRWAACEGTFGSFRFKTRRDHALLAYAEDFEHFDFLLLKVVRGRARLHYCRRSVHYLGECGADLDDNDWHSMKIEAGARRFALSVDGASCPNKNEIKNSTCPLRDSNRRSGFVFFGGVPEKFSDPTVLTLVKHQPKFQGSLRDIRFSQCGGEVHLNQVVDEGGTKSTADDFCLGTNPCQNGGLCVSSDGGALCECYATGRSGTFCDRDNNLGVFTVVENNFLRLEVPSPTLIGTSGELTAWFKTVSPEFTILFIDDQHYRLWLRLMKGQLALSLESEEEVLEADSGSKRGKFQLNDNKWHRLALSIGLKEFTLNIDGMSLKAASLMGTFGSLFIREIFLGGSQEFQPDRRHFTMQMGCLKEVFLSVEGLRVDLISEARSGNSAIRQSTSSISMECQSPTSSRAASLDGNLYIKIPPREIKSLGSSLSFSFQTNEDYGTVICIASQLSDHGTPSVFSVFISKRNIMYYYAASGNVTVNSLATLRDYKTYHVSVNISFFLLTLSLDKKIFVYEVAQSLRDGRMYVVIGRGCAETQTRQRREPTFDNFRGCISNFVLDGYPGSNSMAFYRADEEEMEMSSDRVKSCSKPQYRCSSHPCLHGGKCREGWNRFICDCRGTGFSGILCANCATKKFRFTQNSSLLLPMERWSAVPGSFSARFMARGSTFHLMTLTFQPQVYISLFVRRGVFCVHERTRQNFNTASLEVFVSKNRWHGISVELGKATSIRLDDSTIYETDMQIDRMEKLLLGGSIRTNTRRKHLPEDDLLSSSRVARFHGMMEQLSIDAEEITEDALSIADASVAPEIVTMEPVTFKSSRTFLEVPVDPGRVFRISFQFKTVMQNFLFFVVGNLPISFLMVELVDSNFHLAYHDGLELKKVKIQLDSSVSDNSWHQFSLEIFNETELLIRADGLTHFHYFYKKIEIEHLTKVFLGGFPETEDWTHLKKMFNTRAGYKGCIGQFDGGNGEINLNDERVVSVPHEFIKEIHNGCLEPPDMCKSVECKNGGKCVQSWNSFSCNCHMTTYSGEFCDEEGTGYVFRGGAMVMHLSTEDQTNSRFDQIAFGLSTTSMSGAILSITSSISNDIIKLEMVEGSLIASYNLGLGDHNLNDPGWKINDGNYHVVRFIRSGVNSSMSVDGRQTASLRPKGHQLNTFNMPSKIVIGASSDSVNGRNFIGTLYGLAVNKLSIFDMALKGDKRTKIFGDVTPKTSKRRIIETTFDPVRATCDDEENYCSSSGFHGISIDENFLPTSEPDAAIGGQTIKGPNTTFAFTEISTRGFVPSNASKQLHIRRKTVSPASNDSFLKTILSEVEIERVEKRPRSSISFVMNVALIVGILLAMLTLLLMLFWAALRRSKRGGIQPQSPLKKSITEPAIGVSVYQNSNAATFRIQKHVREWYV